MCEWDYTVDDGEPISGSDLMFLRVRRVLWRMTPWRHGPDCRWHRLFHLGEIVGAND